MACMGIHDLLDCLEMPNGPHQICCVLRLTSGLTTIRPQTERSLKTNEISLEARRLHRGNGRGAACATATAATVVVAGCCGAGASLSEVERGKKEMGRRSGLGATKCHKCHTLGPTNLIETNKLSTRSSDWSKLADHHASCCAADLWNLVTRPAPRWCVPYTILDV